MCVWNAKSQFFQNRAGWRFGLATWLSCKFSRELIEWLVWTFCLVVLQLAWHFSFSICLARVQFLAACKPRATREVQSQVPATLHKLKHFFTLSHTILTWFSPKYRVSKCWIASKLAGIKPTKWLIKFNLTILTWYMILTWCTTHNKNKE